MVESIVIDKMLQCGLLCFVLQAVLSNAHEPNSEMTVSKVTRNVLDSFVFHLEGESCREDDSVCRIRNAVCQIDGSCLCRNATPDYVNPKFVVVHGYLLYGDSDGCMLMTSIIPSIDQDNLPCSYSFSPYQVIPNQPTTIATKYIHAAGGHYSSCNFIDALGKPPGTKIWTPLTWLNEADVNITIDETLGYLYFRWTISVPKLHGLMVVMNLNCSRKYETYANITYTEQCIRAKVLGTTSSTASTTLTHAVLFTTTLLGLFIVALNM